jgi:hypothetical protein
MAEVWKQLYQGQLPAAAGVLYTVPLGFSAIIKYITVNNPSGPDSALELWVGGSADVNSILPYIPLLEKERGDGDFSLVLDAGRTIEGQADDANAITITISGLEVS